MTDEPIDLDAFRREQRKSYVDRDRIESGLYELETAADEITAESVKAFGAVDPLAHEILAHVNAIRRALGEPHD